VATHLTSNLIAGVSSLVVAASTVRVNSLEFESGILFLDLDKMSCGSHHPRKRFCLAFLQLVPIDRSKDQMVLVVRILRHP
jgi:hypothetical protein